MGFKSMIERDRTAVFLNDGEFAEAVRVEGKTITAMLSDEAFTESKKGEDAGLAAFDFVLFALVEDLPEQRPAGESLNINGRECTIMSWKTDMGIASVYLCHQISG